MPLHVFEDLTDQQIIQMIQFKEIRDAPLQTAELAYVTYYGHIVSKDYVYSNEQGKIRLRKQAVEKIVEAIRK